MRICPVCGGRVPHEAEASVEEERYVGAEGCEMKLTIWFCNIGKACSPVAAANKLDEIGEHFIDIVGQR